MPFSLPELPYSYDALAPYMSRETLEFHHDKHHLAYVNNGNNLTKGTEFENRPLEDVVKSSYFGNPALFNNAGQHYNHIHFWKWMKPGGGRNMPGNLEKQIIADFGSVAKMKEDFIQAGVLAEGAFDDLFDRLVFPLGAFGEVVCGRHVGVVMFVVVEFERFFGHVRRERVVRIGKFRQGECH
jgi:hypothetical protein